MVKNLSIFILKLFFLGLNFLKKVRLSISYNISFSQIIIYLEVVLKEFLGLTDLEKAQGFCIHELMKVIMVSKNKNLVFAVF